MTIVRHHDRYVLKAFWASLGAVLVFFTVIVVVVHLADRGGRLLKYFPQLEDAGYNPTMLVLEYYASLTPFIWLQLVPVAGVLAAAFGLSRLTRHGELGPLVSAGVSTRRITLPVVVSGLVLGGGLFLMQETLIPALSRRHMMLDRLLNKSEPDRISRVPHFRDPGGARLSVAAYHPVAQRLEGALLTFRDAEGRPSRLLYYPLLAWNEEEAAWFPERGGTLFPLGEDPTGRLRRPVAPEAPAPLEAGVLLFEVSVLEDLSMGMSTRETGTLLAVDPHNPRLILMHHQGFTRALSALVLLLLGLPLSFEIGRRSALPGTIGVLGVAAGFFGLTFLGIRFATTGQINPVVCAWFPVVTLGAVGLALWLTMRS